MNKINSFVFLTCVLLLSVQSYAAINPVFMQSYVDARTDDNQFSSGGKEYWSIDAGADSYQHDYYERPTAQTYTSTPGGVGASKYYANIDITDARSGYDSQYLFIEITMVGNYFHKDDNTKDYEGLKYEYGFRFSTDADGADGYLMRASFGDPHSQTSWTSSKTSGYQDKLDSDVGGAGGLHSTKDDGDTVIDGFDTQIIDESGVLLVRMVGTNVVQFALDYTQLGLTQAYMEGLEYLDMEAILGDPTDSQKYLWNDKYTSGQAGSPYSTGSLQNVYELDTIRAIPEPATMALLAFGGLIIRKRK